MRATVTGRAYTTPVAEADRPLTTPTGRAQGRPARTLVDCGPTHTIINTAHRRFAVGHGTPASLRLSGAVGATTPGAYLLPSLTVNARGVEVRTERDIVATDAPGLPYDIVLGLPLLAEHGAHIDFPHRSVFFRPGSAWWPGQSPTNHPQFDPGPPK